MTAPDGESYEWVPALAAANGRDLKFGWDAWAATGEPGWTLIRSLKRTLEAAGPATSVEIGGERFAILDLLTGMASALKKGLGGEESLSAVVGIPANANSNQRYLTAEAFRRAGFDVLGLLNEPSAAGIEYGHAQRDRQSGPERLLVYDLGGGTFDASIVDLSPNEHEVLGTESVSTLGGDDFDAALAELAVTPEEFDALDQAATFTLLEQCRAAKEALNPNSRRLTLDLDLVQSNWTPKTIAVADYYAECRPLIEETFRAVEDLIQTTPGNAPDTIYVAGGASELPIVPRMLREKFGRKVKRSSYTRAATAIGLAIQADGQASFTLREKFSRYFGVWREADSGSRILFDPVFSKGTALPRSGEPVLHKERHYSPAHNVGHFRYLEASAIDGDGRPSGDIVLWDEILFPFDPALFEDLDLRTVPIGWNAVAANQEIVETWTCDANGVVEVTISNSTAGYERKYRLARWAGKSEEPAKAKRKRTKA